MIMKYQSYILSIYRTQQGRFTSVRAHSTYLFVRVYKRLQRVAKVCKDVPKQIVLIANSSFFSKKCRHQILNVFKISLQF